ncbi:hypothetical protein LWC08_09005 [Desulfobaculum bizertense]|uniref:hypothetical protein n=1 Tax=Desulfobaculum bizertense TaxID=376490 RepID=UPI001F3B4E42|nr:hypothetical protein [Desulfobaculum bizertense]UIJ36877.1 hypothetical protein LWC08_09005 [Desulfobaculum bizertense]
MSAQFIPLHSEKSDSESRPMSLESFLDGMLYYIEDLQKDLARLNETETAAYKFKPVIKYVDRQIRELVDVLETDLGQITLQVSKHDSDMPLRASITKSARSVG